MEHYVEFFNRYIIGSIQMIFGFAFFIRFFPKKGRRVYYLLFAAFGLAVMQAAPTGGIAEYLIYTLLLIVIGLFICRADWKSVILYAALTVEIMQLSFGMVNSLSGILFSGGLFLHQNTAAVMSVLMGIVALTLAVFCYRAAYRYFLFYGKLRQCKTIRGECGAFSEPSLPGDDFLYYETVEKQYLFIVLIPILMIFFMDEYISSILYGNIVLKNAGGSGISVNHYHMLAIQLFGMASLFCLMFAYKKLLQNFQLNTELSLLEQEESSLNQYVEEARARYEKTKSFRHDIRNHITVVKDLLQNGKSEEALAYIGDMAELSEGLSFPCSTGNPVADILLGNKLGIAESMGIDVDCSLHLPYPCPIRDIDFGIILSNALDNAIRACRDVSDGSEKYIRVTGRIQGDFVLVEVENSFLGTGAAVTGTGLSNIKSVAEKYQGAISIKTQDSSFLLSVLLVIPRHGESIPRQIG
ncbi:MAG: GHKL domain-containing protein [Lachnospiraceae bacterium]|nr:GHKL domain-containing protein [Lachnospiraceae bacterium]